MRGWLASGKNESAVQINGMIYRRGLRTPKERKEERIVKLTEQKFATD